MLPDYDTVIFDEAHLLEEIATLYFGVQVSSGQVEELARDAEGLAARGDGPARGGGGAAVLREAAAEFFQPLRELLRDAQGRDRLRSGRRVAGRISRPSGRCSAEALDEVAAGGCRRERRRGCRRGAARAAPSDLREALDHVLRPRRSPASSTALNCAAGPPCVLSASPIDVSDLLRERAVRAAARLRADLGHPGRGGPFDFFQSRLGLDRRREPGRGLLLRSPRAGAALPARG